MEKEWNLVLEPTKVVKTDCPERFIGNNEIEGGLISNCVSVSDDESTGLITVAATTNMVLVSGEELYTFEGGCAVGSVLRASGKLATIVTTDVGLEHLLGC